MNDEFDLLKLNYENLHQSIQNNFSYSWAVSGIFIPLLFTLQGLVIKFFKPFDQPLFQTAIYALIIEFMVIIWWLMMLMFRSYNRTRIYRLRELEFLFDNDYTTENLRSIEFMPVKQYYKLNYQLNFKGWKIKFFHTYDLFFITITAINGGLVLTTYKLYNLESIFKIMILIIVFILLFLISIVKYADLLDEREKKLSFDSFKKKYWQNKGKVFNTSVSTKKQ